METADVIEAVRFSLNAALIPETGKTDAVRARAVCMPYAWNPPRKSRKAHCEKPAASVGAWHACCGNLHCVNQCPLHGALSDLGDQESAGPVRVQTKPAPGVSRASRASSADIACNGFRDDAANLLAFRP